MKLWSKLKPYQYTLRTYAPKFLETCETLEMKFGPIASLSYQERIYTNSKRISAVFWREEPMTAIARTMEKISWASGKEIFEGVMIELELFELMRKIETN